MSQMTIGKKLTYCTGAMLVMSLVLGIYSLTAIIQLRQGLERAIGETVQKAHLVSGIDVAASDMLGGQRGVVLYAFGKVPAASAQSAEFFQSASGRYEKALEALKPLLVVEEAKQLASGSGPTCQPGAAASPMCSG